VPITTIFFDLYQTLVYFYPEREYRQAEALRQLGIEADPADIRRGYLAADHYYTLVGMETPIHLLSSPERDRVYLRYQEVMLEEAGLGHLTHLAEKLRALYWEQWRELRLFPEVDQLLSHFRSAGYRLGLITNVADDPSPDLERLGLLRQLDVVVASCLAGVEKPNAAIFQAALREAGVSPDQGLHVGDQLLADVEGARAVGMAAVLLDRHGLQQGRYPHTIRSLDELPALLENGLEER